MINTQRSRGDNEEAKRSEKNTDRVAREGHLEEGTSKGCFKSGVALARARQDGRRKVLVEWEGIKEGREGYTWGFRQFTQWPPPQPPWTLRE